MISDNKMKHILGVARKCKEIAKEKNLPEDKQNAAFVMGFLHDIGYELCDKDEISKHPEKGYQMIKDFLKYETEITEAIKCHGKKLENLSEMDLILNTADLTIDYIGNDITVEDRIKGITERHGKDNIHTKHAVAQCEALKKHFKKF